jgi:uncharacterized membrane protein YidH (DUF202 family)
MGARLRTVLAILATGLAVEAFVSSYLYLGGQLTFAVAGVFLGLGPVAALVGLLILWAGRRQWNRMSGGDLHAANISFGLSIFALSTVVGLVGWYAYQGASALPILSLWSFAIAVWASLFLTFVTFGLIAYDFSGMLGRASLLIGLGWAAAISGWFGFVLSQEIGPILRLVEVHSTNLAPIGISVVPLEGLFAPAYVLLLIAYLDAIRCVPYTSKKSRGPAAARQPA